MLDFDQICILIAAALAVFSIKRYRYPSLILLAGFIGFEVAHNTIEMYQSFLPEHTTQTVYCLILGLIIVALSKYGGFAPLCVLLSVYCLYCFFIVAEFQYGSLGLHDKFKSVGRAVMTLELLSMLSISGIGKYAWNRFNKSGNYTYMLDRFYANRFRLGSQGLV
jgi:hypothetical protein